jgi:hypothetical protein
MKQIFAIVTALLLTPLVTLPAADALKPLGAHLDGPTIMVG